MEFPPSRKWGFGAHNLIQDTEPEIIIEEYDQGSKMKSQINICFKDSGRVVKAKTFNNLDTKDSMRKLKLYDRLYLSPKPTHY